MVYYKFLNQISNDKKITIYGNNNSIRSFTYIDDVTKALEILIKKFSKKKYNDSVNIGNINKDSLKDLIEIIKSKFSADFTEIILDRNKSDMLKTAASVKKLNKLTKFYPKINLDKGMTKFIKWYKKEILI